jgi:competence ComEA-like helix-hairpin-helix protein
MIPKFSRKEIIVLSVLIVTLVAVNAVNFINRRKLEKGLALVVEEGQAPVSLNTAGSSDLEDLPGIGPALAERIIAFRAESGGYRNLDELKKVKGIGEKLYLKILPFIKL